MSDAELFALQLLKNDIEFFKKVSSDFKIFVWSDNSFLAYQYAREIAKVRGLAIKYVDSLDDAIDSLDDAFSFEEPEDVLKVYSCQKFDIPRDISSLNNIIVICQDITGDSSCVYKFPKLEDWQMVAFMKQQCPGLNDNEIKWLFDITASISKNNENIFRLDNEAKKINCFSKDEQEQVFHELSDASGYCDLSPLTIFNFTNAILKKDTLSIKDVLRDIDSIDIEGTGLITILHKNFKQIIDIQLSRNATPESLGMSIKQFKAIEYNCGKFSSSSLINIFEFITGLDYKLKSGQLDIINQRLIDYIVCSVLSL